MMKPYRLVFIPNVISEGSGQSRRVTQSFGAEEESRHLRTPNN